MPPPMSFHSARCFGVASRSLGNHASGTETIRPSFRTTLSASLVQDTSTAVASLLSTKVLMPLLQKETSVLNDQLPNLSKLVATKTAIVRQVHGLDPEFRVSPGMSHMYVWWLTTLHAEEEEPVTADLQQGGHALVYRNRKRGNSRPRRCLTFAFQPRRLTPGSAAEDCKRGLHSSQAVRNASRLGAHAGRISGFFGQAEDAEEVLSVRVKAILCSKSSKRVQCGEPTEIDVSILYFTGDPNSTLELVVSQRFPLDAVSGHRPALIRAQDYGFQTAIGSVLRTKASQPSANVPDGSQPAGSSADAGSRDVSTTRAEVALKTGLFHSSVTWENSTVMYPCLPVPHDLDGAVRMARNQSRMSVCTFCKQQ